MDGRDAANIGEMALAAKGGSVEARNALYFRCEALVRARCRRARRVAERFADGAGPISGEDVDQQSFILFCDLLDEWRPESASFQDYLIRFCGSRAQHYVRRTLGYRNKLRVIRLTPPDEGMQFDPPSEAASRQIEQAEHRADWHDQTELLNARWKRLVVMKFEDDLTTGEISVIDGHSRRTVNRDLRSALNAIRAQLEEEWQDCV